MNGAREKLAHANGSRRGSVLLIVMITLALLALLVVTLVSTQTAARISVVAAREMAQQEYTATGGLEIACTLLMQDKKDSDNDNLFEAWAQPRRCDIGGYDCEILIVDEESKINATSLSSEDEEAIKRMARLLTMLVEGLKIEVAEKKVAEACKKMADDLAKDSISVTSFEQLAKYPPFTEEIVYGKKDETGKIVGAGLTDFVTFENTAKVNINTAPREVLLAVLDFENEKLVDRIIEFRESADDDGNRYGFTNFTELKKTSENPDGDYEGDILYHEDSIALMSANFDINSNIFTINAVSPTSTTVASGADGEEADGPALPARGWVWTVERKNTGEIVAISLRASTRPARYLNLEGNE